MNNTSKIAIASGIVFGVGALYAYKHRVDFKEVLNIFEENQTSFNEFIKELMTLCYEILVNIFNAIVELVREISFKIKLLVN